MTDDVEPSVIEAVNRPGGATAAERIARAEEKLRQRDETDRRARAVRMVLLDDALADIPSHVWGFVAGTPEITFLQLEARAAYLAGLGGCAVICAHSACERELAAWVQSLGAGGPRGWTRWGLGKLTDYAVEQGYVTEQIGTDLRRLNERRRFLYHLQNEESPQMTYRRAYEGISHKYEWSANMHSLLLSDGLDSIRTMGLLAAHLAPF